MSYEHRSNINKRDSRFPIKTILAICLILFLFKMFAPTFFTNTFTYIFGFMWDIERNIKHENIYISTEVQDAIVSELKKENEELKSLLGRHTSSSRDFLAYIVKKPPFTAYDSYIIEIGKNNNVKIGDKVYSIGKILLGEIAEINGHFAKVKLYSSSEEKYDVFIGDENIQTTAIGQGGGFFEVVLPRDVKIKEGDVVKVPSLSSSVFGIVKKVTIDPARAFTTVLFSQSINIYEQKWVVIEI